MDFIELHKKTLIHTLVIIFMLLPATGFAVPQQQTDITKPTRERVKSSDKKTPTDKNTSPDKNSDKNKKGGKADDKKNDKSPAAAAPANPQKDNKVAEKTDDGDKKGENAADGNQPAAEKPKLAPMDLNYNGIDVSKHQGVINWDEVKKDGKIQYVYIKATEGSDRVDERYQANLRNARKAGFKVGSYHYLTNKSSVTTQFKNFATNAPRDQQDLIPVIDVEVCKQWDAQQLRDSLKVFANMVEDYYGCRPIIYTYESFFKKYLGKAFADYPIFIAKYSRTASDEPNINVKWILWQYSENGSVNGIKGSVDLSRFSKGHSIQEILYRPAKGKPKISVKDAVDRNKPKPVTVNLMEQPAQTEKQKEEAGKKSNEVNSKAKTEQANKAKAEKEKAEKEKAEKEKAKADKAKAEKAKAEKAKAEKAKAEKEKADKAKAERAKAERERAEKAKAEQEAKNKRKAEAKKAREEKAKQNTSSKGTSNKGAYASKLTQSQRNDSIRSAQQSGRKSNKSSADND